MQAVEARQTGTHLSERRSTRQTFGVNHEYWRPPHLARCDLSICCDDGLLLVVIST